MLADDCVNQRRAKDRECTCTTEKPRDHLQVLGLFLLGAVGADLTAAGGSGAELGGEEGEHTLHHPRTPLAKTASDQ